MRIEPISSSLNPASAEGITSGAGAALPLPGAASQPSEAGKTFGQFLMDSLSEVNTAQLKAGEMNAKFAAGKPVDIHQVMIASQEASVMLNLALQVRNKIMDAYQEVMRVNV